MNEIITYINFIISAITLLTVVFWGGSFIGKTNTLLDSLVEKSRNQNTEIEKLKETVTILRTLSKEYESNG